MFSNFLQELLSEELVEPVTAKDAVEYLKKTPKGKATTIGFELVEEYETQLMINKFKGEEPKRGRKVLNEIKEKHLRKVQEINPLISEEALFRSINRALKDTEKEIDWNMFESKRCANRAIAYIDSGDAGVTSLGNKMYALDLSSQALNYKSCKKEHKFTCSKCMKVSYCSKECSIQYWPYHKKLCKALQEIASEVD